MDGSSRNKLRQPSAAERKDERAALDDEPDSPTSRLMNRIAAIKLNNEELGTSPNGEKKFRYIDDIARNPALAQAARLDLQSGQATPTSPGDGLPFISHDPDIDRQQEVCEALDRDTHLESQLNQEMASVVIGRVQSGRTSAEKVLSVLQAFASAERSYSKALISIGDLDLTGDADGATLREALADFVHLPKVIGGAHEKASQASQPPINLVRDLVAKLRDACVELRQGSLRVQSDVDASMKALKQAVAAHRDVCKAFDASILSKGRFSVKSKNIEADPWIAEGRLVERQAGLRVAQASQRKWLSGAFRRVGELERQRITVTRMALINFVEQMGCSISSVFQDQAESVLSSLSAVNGESDLESFVSMAADSIKGGESLSSRQSQMIQYLWRQLEGSGEIIRQGSVSRMETNKTWSDGYAVLTRAGFLHWFKSSGEDESAWCFSGGPQSSINISKCDFELCDAPSWRLTELTSGVRPISWLGGHSVGQTYSTNNVDSCMDWAADLKEMISSYKLT